MNPLDPQELMRQGHMLIDFIGNYYQNIEQYPVLSQVQPGYLRQCLPESAPAGPESIETILEDIKKHIIPGITHWQSPNFFGYFPCSGSTAGFLGEMLSAGLDVVAFNWQSSPAVTELETIIIDWLGKLLQLPETLLFCGGGGGVLQGTTCEALVATLVAARERALTKIGRQNIGKLVVYCSDQTHSSVLKAAKIVGLDPDNFRPIATTISSNFELSPAALRTAILSDLEVGLVPFYLCVTIGTTSSTAVDPLGPLVEVAKEYEMWIHVDAAYAGSACICPEFRHFLDGIEGVNSFSLNAHKWFFTNLDCCCLWVKNPSDLTKALSTNPEFLRNEASDSKLVVDYKDWQITLSRRFRSLKLWLVLRSYGSDNLRSFLREHVKMAKHFENLVNSDMRFEVVVPRTFAMVCFRVSPSHIFYNEMKRTRVEEDVNEINKKLLESVNGSGQVYMTHTVIGEMYVIRFAIGATLTEYRHVIAAWKVVQEHATSILGAIGSINGHAIINGQS